MMFNPQLKLKRFKNSQTLFKYKDMRRVIRLTVSLLLEASSKSNDIVKGFHISFILQNGLISDPTNMSEPNIRPHPNKGG